MVSLFVMPVRQNAYPSVYTMKTNKISLSFQERGPVGKQHLFLAGCSVNGAELPYGTL